MRRVRTVEGARLYGKPIGTPIGNAADQKDGKKRPVTIERLNSLQSQFVAAKRTGNAALMKDIQAEFTAAVKEFQANHQDPELLRKLVGDRGRQEQSSQKGS